MEEVWNKMDKAKTRRYITRQLADAPSLQNKGGKPQITVVNMRIVYSYNTPVAYYENGTLWVPNRTSTTTSRHINKVAAEWRAPVVKMWK
tara:strand:- start:77 stop:346 length:270 start_codon:yes stop_codon:yes gene_type:complete